LIANINVHCFLGEKIRNQYVDYVRDSMLELESNGYTLLSLLYPSAPFGGPAGNKKLRAKLEKFFATVLENRRKNNIDENDYLGYLMKRQEQDPNFTDRHILVAVLGIFFAARINTVRTTIWIIASTVFHPGIREKLMPLLVNKPTDWQTIKTNTYIDSIMKESSRVYGGVTTGLRKVVGNNVKYQNYTLPKGAMVTTLYSYNAMDPKLITKPEIFDPDRWERDIIDPFIYIPFSRGQHRCKGEIFAVQVIKTISTLLFANYEVKQKDTNYKLEPAIKVATTGIPSLSEPYLLTIKKF